MLVHPGCERPRASGCPSCCGCGCRSSSFFQRCSQDCTRNGRIKQAAVAFLASGTLGRSGLRSTTACASSPCGGTASDAVGTWQFWRPCPQRRCPPLKKSRRRQQQRQQRHARLQYLPLRLRGAEQTQRHGL